MNITDVVKKVTDGAQGSHGTLSKLMGMMGGENNAGLNNLLSSLQSAGLTDQVKSWAGKGGRATSPGGRSPHTRGPSALTTPAWRASLVDWLARVPGRVIGKVAP